MTRQEMQNKLDRKDITGVGVKVTWGDNNVIYYFYEDFEDSKGVDRASKHFANMINNGKVRKAEYIYKQQERKAFPGVRFPGLLSLIKRTIKKMKGWLIV